MKKIAAFLIAAQLALTSSPLWAQEYAGAHNGSRTVETRSWVEEWDPVRGRWVKVDGEDLRPEGRAMPTVVTTITNAKAVSETLGAVRYAGPVPVNRAPATLAQYGPFIVVGTSVAKMVSSTNGRSPQDFDAMMHDFPGISILEMVEAPGTSNDIANLAVGRRIREAGISTHVPRGGSVRSGAVELFLAGASRSIEDGATFAVHSWLDNHGREADDFAADHPAHRLYLDYYVEMGMSEAQARNFYAMTNSVPHASARWLKADEMRSWIAPEQASLQRYAARQVETAQIAATCTFCEGVRANVAAANASTQSMDLGTLALNAVPPAIDYSDVTGVKIAAKNALADTSLLDS
ncbi:MAG: hypothetical protein ABJ205_11915 [Erythrobacter sp.]|uniref:hypothetical protein n=1 Tax=Erythrobacter sp. TaxID=1042 RepID=UPI003267799D